MKSVWDVIELLLIMVAVFTVVFFFFRAMYIISVSVGVFFRPFQF
jgi:hypothetical protein